MKNLARLTSYAQKLNPLSRDVVSVHQSPMNAERWMLVLSCGHKLWVTAKRRPQRKWEICPQEDCKSSLRAGSRSAQDEPKV